MEKMTFTTDCTALTEGEVITVTWDCTGAERVELNIDNGFKATSLALDISGVKRFRLNRSKGRTRLTITAWINGKSYSKTIKVKVNEMRATRAETVGDDYASRPPKTGLAAKWQELKVRYKAAWQAMPPMKKLCARLLYIIAGILLLSMITPWFMPVGLVGMGIYLVWQMRR